jgi:hypothetical protein
MEMYSLNQVIKEFKKIIKQYELSSGTNSSKIEIQYYKIIVKYLLLEHKFPHEVKRSKKPIYHYFMYYLPEFGTDYFNFLYNTYNPVRFAVETFDSIEEIKLELKR